VVLLRVTSYNMRQGGSRSHWVKILSATTPDLLLVQETKDPTQFTKDLLEPLNIDGVLWNAADQNRWGSAVLWQGEKLTEITVPGFGGWVTGGEVRLQEHDVFVFSVHLPRSEGTYVKAAHLLMDELAPIVGTTPCLVGGDWDFTACLRDPGDPRGHRPGEVEFIHRMADEFHLQAAWRLAHPKGDLPQTLRWTREPRTPYHCDGLFVPANLRGQGMTARVLSGLPWLNLSDHNPLEVTWDGPIVVDHRAV